MTATHPFSLEPTTVAAAVWDACVTEVRAFKPGNVSVTSPGHGMHADDFIASADATAAEDTLLLVVERRHFLPFVRNNDDLYLRLLAVICDRLRRTSLALEELALFDLPARLARVLLKMAEDYGRPAIGGGMRIDMKLSQRDLSTLVASSRESVNKQMQSWRKGGVVDMDAGYIVVRSASELAMLVE